MLTPSLDCSSLCRASLSGLAARRAQRCRHTLDSPRARQNSSPTQPPPTERIDDRDPCLAELLFHLDGEQTWAGAVLPSALSGNRPQEVRSPASRRVAASRQAANPDPLT